MLILDRKQQNSVKQLSFNEKLIIKCSFCKLKEHRVKLCIVFQFSFSVARNEAVIQEEEGRTSQRRA